MKSVTETASKITTDCDKIDALFNIAGLVLFHREETVDGFEKMFATNYLSHFILTNHLIENLARSGDGRIINVSGEGHKKKFFEGNQEADIHFDDLHFASGFNISKAAKQPVLARILFTYELSRSIQNKNIQVCTFSPSLVKSDLTKNLPLPVRMFVAMRTLLGHAREPKEAAADIIKLLFRNSRHKWEIFSS